MINQIVCIEIQNKCFGDQIFILESKCPMNDKIDKANISSETNEKLAVQVRHQHGTTKR